jgi:hypothetical protein
VHVKPIALQVNKILKYARVHSENRKVTRCDIKPGSVEK